MTRLFLAAGLALIGVRPGVGGDNEIILEGGGGGDPPPPVCIETNTRQVQGVSLDGLHDGACWYTCTVRDRTDNTCQVYPPPNVVVWHSEVLASVPISIPPGGHGTVQCPESPDYSVCCAGFDGVCP